MSTKNINAVKTANKQKSTNNKWYDKLFLSLIAFCFVVAGFVATTNMAKAEEENCPPVDNPFAPGGTLYGLHPIMVFDAENCCWQLCIYTDLPKTFPITIKKKEGNGPKQKVVDGNLNNPGPSNGIWSGPICLSQSSPQDIEIELCFPVEDGECCVLFQTIHADQITACNGTPTAYDDYFGVCYVCNNPGEWQTMPPTILTLPEYPECEFAYTYKKRECDGAIQIKDAEFKLVTNCPILQSTLAYARAQSNLDGAIGDRYFALMNDIFNKLFSRIADTVTAEIVPDLPCPSEIKVVEYLRGGCVSYCKTIEAGVEVWKEKQCNSGEGCCKLSIEYRRTADCYVIKTGPTTEAFDNGTISCPPNTNSPDCNGEQTGCRPPCGYNGQ